MKYIKWRMYNVEQNLTYLLGLKEVEIGELQIVKEQLEQKNTKLQEDIHVYLFKTRFQLNWKDERLVSFY